MKLHNSIGYEEKLKDYKLYDDLFEGKQSVMVSEKYLPKHPLEQDITIEGALQIRKTRESLSRYTNFSTRAFRRYKSIIFKKDPTLNEEAEKFLVENNLLNNIDGQGTNVIEFIKNQLFKNKFKKGDSYILTTKEEGTNSVGQWECIDPIVVKNWGIKGGQLSLFRYEYKVVTQANSQEKAKEVYYSDEFVLDGEVVKLTRYKATKVKQGEPDWEIDPTAKDLIIENFTKIPVTFCFSESFIKEASNDILEYHNIKSSLLNQLHHQAFQKIIVTGEQIDDKQKFAFASYAINIVRGQGVGVTVIEPTDTTSMREQLRESSDNVFKSFYHYNRMIASGSGVGESSESQEQAKQDLLNVIKSEIGDLSRQSNESLKDLATQAGIEDFKGEITFNDDISIQDIDSMLKEELAYLDIIQKNYPTFFKAVMKKVAKRQKLENEDEIIKEIDAVSAEPKKESLTFDTLVDGN